MANLDLQKVLQMAGDEKILNLDMTFREFANSKTFGSLSAYEEPWEVFCGTTFRIVFWRGPRLRDSILENFQLVDSLKESLNLTNELGHRLEGIRS